MTIRAWVVATTVREVLDVLDEARLHGAADAGAAPGEVIVTWPNAAPVPPTWTRDVAAALTARGYDCTRSRTRVSVMRAGERPPLGAPDFVCRRAPEPEEPDWQAIADELAAALLRHIEVCGGTDHHPADCGDAACVMNRRVSSAIAKYEAAKR